jgi:HPt (histidine-containing phosphotransfer) domain-containing protein
MTLDDRQLMSEIVWALVDDASRHAAEIEAAAHDLDAVRATRVARYAARSCTNVGAQAAAEAFRALERHAAVRDFTACRAALSRARNAIERLREEASQII